MQEGQLLMTQADRDRLVALKKAKKNLITQREAAEELKLSIRQVQRLLYGLKERGDKAVVHRLRGRASNRRIEERIEREAVRILSAPVYEGFGPTLAAEYLGNKHGIEASKETVRQWMMRAKLWRGRKEKVRQVHTWRPRRSRFGELVQWDTSEHDWLEGRGEKLYLIAMIDDATSGLFARFVRHDSTQENMKVLWSYLEKFGRPLAFYTDKASLFQTAEKRKREARLSPLRCSTLAHPPCQLTLTASFSPRDLKCWIHARASGSPCSSRRANSSKAVRRIWDQTFWAVHMATSNGRERACPTIASNRSSST